MIIDLFDDAFDLEPFYPGGTIGKFTVYTIWTFDPSSDDYQLLYVGKTDGESEIIDKDSIKLSDWTDFQISGLYIGTTFMPDTEFEKEQRQVEADRLVSLYRPICNTVYQDKV